jgi:hypothetical protein
MKAYSKKARAILISAQAVAGIPTASADIVGADSLACFEPSYSIETTQESIEFAGDEFSRDSRTDITDRVLNVSFSSLLPSLPTPVAAATITDFPQEVLFESTGASVIYGAGTGAAARVTVTNSQTSSTKMTMFVSAVSSDDLSLQKVYGGFDGNSTLDLEMEIDKRVRLKWSAKSIPVDWAATPAPFPEEIPKVDPDYGVQKDNVMPTLSMRNVLQAELVVFGSKGYQAGTEDLPLPFTGTVKNFCFSKLTANALFGFTWERLHNSCQTGFEKLVSVPDISITILEDDTSAVLQPDRNIADGGMQEQYYAFGLTFGSVGGKKVYLTFDRIQCVDSKPTEIGSRAAKELTFKNCSFATLMFAPSA